MQVQRVVRSRVKKNMLSVYYRKTGKLAKLCYGYHEALGTVSAF